MRPGQALAIDTILIVEDDVNVRLGCSQTLQLEGIRVEEAESAEQALRLLHNGWPGIVVSDVRLPGAGGMSLLQQLQQLLEQLRSRQSALRMHRGVL